ncbi:MAG: hypothetical protein JWM74_4156, partial [Myxococcaceae bacterium]|nr:hypothetical protein [Myxococcaceae bacterium]
LSASPNENEARNAAWLAVKAIREHKLDIVDSGSVVQRPTPPAPRRQAPRKPSQTTVTINGVRFDGVVDFDFDFSEIFGARPRTRFVPTGPARTSRHHGTCAKCKDTFKPGDHITAATDETKGVVHADCASFWEVPA